MENNLNLVTDPWIKVITNNGQEKTVSLSDLFKSSQNYRQLAGDLRAQDLALLRFFLAILVTVYSRYDENGTPYDWLELNTQNSRVTHVEDDDYDDDDLLSTWKGLYDKGSFSDIVQTYLTQNKDRFYLFGDANGKYPFAQLSQKDYLSVYPPASKPIEILKEKSKKGTLSGIVVTKQFNRTVSESNNKLNIFTPVAGNYKEQISQDALARWLISYQNFAGNSDKSKIFIGGKKGTFSNTSGWLYNFRPVFIKGSTIFETLMMNLILGNRNLATDKYSLQAPMWEYDSLSEYKTLFQNQFSHGSRPNNLAGLYTTWARAIHIEPAGNNQYAIFVAGVPRFYSGDTFIEPMCFWHKANKKAQEDNNGEYTPTRVALANQSQSIWRYFGDLVQVRETGNQSEMFGAIAWIRYLQREGYINPRKKITLRTLGFVEDGNSTSQLPAAEVLDDLTLSVDVLLESKGKNFWQKRLSDVVEMTDSVGHDYSMLVDDLYKLRGFQGNIYDRQKGRDPLVQHFYDSLNIPFKKWIGSLSITDDRDQRIIEWKKTLSNLANNAANELGERASISDFNGKQESGRINNIFTITNTFLRKVKKDIDTEGIKNDNK